MNLDRTPAELRAARGQLWLMFGLLAGGVAFVWWSTRNSSRSAIPGPQAADSPANLTQYVGAQRCAECHAQEAAAHTRSGHARTFSRSKDSVVAKSLCGTAHAATDGYGRFDYYCDADGLLVAQEERFGSRKFPLDFAFGSGDHAVTFLTLLGDERSAAGLVGIEHRYTWFRDRQGLGVTPGQEHDVPQRDVEQFGRVHDAETVQRCIGCHTTSYRIEGNRLVELLGNVQCESCHGPGAAHVAAAVAGDTAGVRQSLRKPQSPAEDVAFCGRCHRLPADIAAERLARYPPSLTRFQPVGLLRSRCYLESHGRLGCLTCHDAHGPLSDRSAADQVAACRQCHQPGDAAVCRAGHGEGCVACHMRRLELIPGMFFHDHWIRTRPEENGAAFEREATSVSGEQTAP